ncbi:MAG: MtnX-like HAD-IB family phosphatase [Proteobacteria bacterium]|nr:MtnX-like HAD-IB family phosphatase [Pseudomonadota bacterium]
MNKRITFLDASGWTIQSDFDGTISLLDVTDTLLTRFGQPGWRELEDAWERGEIGSRECMKGQVALLDMSEAELQAHLDEIAIDPGFAGFVQLAQEHGVQVQVVSDGLDYCIRHVLRRHGLGHLPVVANRLAHTGERSWRLDFPWASPRCERASGNCKCERLAEAQGPTGRVLYVGDSTSDFCVSGRADFVLAKYKLIAHCEQHGISHAPFTDFTQARDLLEGVLLGLEAPA